MMKPKFSIFCLLILFIAIFTGCNLGNNPAKNKGDTELMDNTTENQSSKIKAAQKKKSKIIPASKIVENRLDTLSRNLITRNVNGEQISFKLNNSESFHDNKVYWKKKLKGFEYPLRVEEIVPNVALFYKPFSEVRWDQHQQEFYNFNRIVPDRLEFFDPKDSLLNTFDISLNNPYLSNTSKNINVTEYFNNIAEYYQYLPLDKQTKKEVVTDQWVYSHVLSQGDLTILRYKTNFATKHFIVGTKYNYIVFDKAGNKIVDFHSDHDQLVGVAFSPDAHYLILSYTQGETTINAGNKTSEEGFEIWDTKKNKLLHSEIKEDPEISIQSPGIAERLNCIGVTYTYVPASNIEYRKNINNPVSKSVYFDYNKISCFSFVNTVQDEINQISYLKKYQKYQKVEDLFKKKTLSTRELNYGK